MTAALGFNARQRRLGQENGEGSALLGAQSWTTRRPSGSYRNRVPGKAHHRLSAALLFATIFFMFVGMGNTFLRTGRLFPGPHLYGGFALVLFASANVALVPWMLEKSRLRLLHICFGTVILALVLSQIVSGWPILRAVWQSLYSFNSLFFGMQAQ